MSCPRQTPITLVSSSSAAICRSGTIEPSVRRSVKGLFDRQCRLSSCKLLITEIRVRRFRQWLAVERQKTWDHLEKLIDRYSFSRCKSVPRISSWVLYMNGCRCQVHLTWLNVLEQCKGSRSVFVLLVTKAAGLRWSIQGFSKSPLVVDEPWI